MADKSLRFGIKEDRDYNRPPISRGVYLSDGPYRGALTLLDRFLDKPVSENAHRNYWRRARESGSTLPAADFEGARERHRASIRWIMVVEAEEGRLWSTGPKDYLSMLREYHQEANEDGARIQAAIDRLINFDKNHAYLLRHSLQHAMQSFLSDEKIRRVKQPNANLKNGFRWRTVSGSTVRENEFQFLSKLTLFELEELLRLWKAEVKQVFKPSKRPWMEFGALRFEQRIDPRSASKMNVSQLGLLARLSSRMRDFSAGYGIWAYSRGQPIPTHGKPCWNIVAEFINCALEPQNPLTAESAQRIWGSFSSKHQPTMQQWPNPAKQELQVVEN